MLVLSLTFSYNNDVTDSQFFNIVTRTPRVQRKEASQYGDSSSTSLMPLTNHKQTCHKVPLLLKWNFQGEYLSLALEYKSFIVFRYLWSFLCGKQKYQTYIFIIMLWDWIYTSWVLFAFLWTIKYSIMLSTLQLFHLTRSIWC